MPKRPDPRIARREKFGAIKERLSYVGFWGNANESMLHKPGHDTALMQKVYNDTRWRLYCMYCDKRSIPSVKPFMARFDTLTCGQREQVLHDIEEPKRRDGSTCLMLEDYSFIVSTEFKPLFIWAPYCINNSVAAFVYCSGHFDRPVELELYYGGYRILKWSKFKPEVDPIAVSHSRIYNPLQPDVIKYIRDNDAILNPWFLEEARRRCVFDSTQYPPAQIDRQIREDAKYHYDQFYIDEGAEPLRERAWQSGEIY